MQLKCHFQNHLASASITAVGWNKDGTVNWGLKSNGDYRSDDVSTIAVDCGEYSFYFIMSDFIVQIT
jgi:hypothetical protein